LIEFDEVRRQREQQASQQQPDADGRGQEPAVAATQSVELGKPNILPDHVSLESAGHLTWMWTRTTSTRFRVGSTPMARGWSSTQYILK